MYTYRQKISFALLLILFFGQIESTCINYGEFLEKQLIVDVLTLLKPETLLKNHRILHETIINDACDRDLVLYGHALEHKKSWALRMLDASSKVPAGVLQGHVIDMGMFDECVESHGQTDDIQIQGRHCMYAVTTKSETQFFINPTLSICLPASCDTESVLDLLNGTINNTEKMKNLGINVVSASCSDSTSNYTSTSFTITMIVSLIYMTILVVCTICDLFHRKFEKNRFKQLKTLERFSLFKNTKAVFSTEVHDTDIPVIHGLRAISCCSIVLLHEHFLQILGVHVNTVYVTEWYSSWNSMYVLMSWFTVDTFFALSGFLMAYKFFQRIHKTRKFNVPLYYLHRFNRLTFPVLILVVTVLIVVPTFQSGARCNWFKNMFIKGCESKWWTFFVYFQNFFEKNNLCLIHLWQLSVDMQLYWLSPFILYPLYKRSNFGLTFLVSLILASAFVSGLLVGFNKYPALNFPQDINLPQMWEVFLNVYMMPYTRASPWLIGILFAYAVIHEENFPNKLFISFGWILATASFAFCFFGTRLITQSNCKYNLVEEVIFASLSRPCWAFGIGWIIYASIHSAAGPLSSFLSMNIFLPVSRLSYSIYLTHTALPMLQVATIRAPTHLNQYSIIHSYISNMFLSVIIGLLFHIVFEAPFFILEDTFLEKMETISQKFKKTN